MEIKQVPNKLVSALPLLWLSISFLLGILLASLQAAAFWLWLLFALFSLAIAIAFRRRLAWPQRLLLLAACALFLGAARFQVAQPHFSPVDLAYYNDAEQSIEVQGILIKPPVRHESYFELTVRVSEILFSNGQSIPVRGLLIARIDPGSSWSYGDELQIRGELQTPPDYEDFSYGDYLSRQGIHSLMPFAAAKKLASGRGNPLWSLLYSLRERSVEILHRIYPDPEASLLAGILLGDESGLSASLKAAFNDTGTRHIIAISGFNISIIAGLMLTVFSRWLGVRRGIWLAVFGIAFYTLLVGAEASVVRAAIMGILALVARQVGRQQFGLNTLAFSAALMNLVNPFLLWDVGFQLSFAATLGLILYAGPIETRVMAWLSTRLAEDWVARLRGPLSDYVFLTLAAQVTTLPLLLYHFHRLSLFSLPANLLILPAQPALMVLAGLSTLAGLIWLPAGQLLAFLAWPLAAYTIRVVLAFAAVPWAAQNVSSFPLILAGLYYLALLALTVPAIRHRFTLVRIRPVYPLIALAAVCFWIWSSALAAPKGRLDLTLLDVGGEALLIRTPAGRSLLINGGPSGTRLAEELGHGMPGFDRKLDWLIIAGQRPEQISALLLAMDRISFDRLGWAGSPKSEVALQLWDAIKEHEPSPSRLQAGSRFDLGEGVFLEVLAVGERGATLLLGYGNFRALLPLGLDFEQLEGFNLGRSIGSVSLLLLADSGYPPLNPAEWIANLDPGLIWLPASGDPLAPELLNVLTGMTWLQAEELGWLRVSTDGQRMWAETEH